MFCIFYSKRYISQHFPAPDKNPPVRGSSPPGHTNLTSCVPFFDSCQKRCCASRFNYVQILSQISAFVKSWPHQIHGNRISFFPLAWERQCWFFGVSTLGCTHMSRGKPGRCRASLISKHGTSISSCHCIFAPTAPVTAVLRNFPLYHQTAAEGTPSAAVFAI